MKKVFLKLLFMFAALFIGIMFVFADDDVSYLMRLTNGFGGAYSTNANEIKLIKFIDTNKENFNVPEGITGVDLSYETDQSVMGYLVEDEETYILYVVFAGNLKLNSKSSNLFYNLASLELIEGLEYVDTSNVTEMASMFAECPKLQGLDLSHFNTSKVTTMQNMFKNDIKLVSLDLSSFDTGLVETMYGMFDTCTSLESINLTSFNTEKVTNTQLMFHSCSSLETIDLSSFNTEGVTTYNSMFAECSALKYLDLKSFTLSTSATYKQTFQGCSSLETIYVPSGTDLTSVLAKQMNAAFAECESLVGEKGTTYNSSFIANQYARVDGGEEAPGYFSSSLSANNFEISYEMDQEYTGSAIIPSLTVKYGNKTLVKDTDYQVTATNNVELGEATMTIKGINDYSGEVVKHFNVVQANIENAVVSEISEQVYTGNAITPGFTVTYLGKTLVKDTDYEVVYSANTSVGQATITISGIGNFNGTKLINFNIIGKDIKDATLSKVEKQIYTGSAITPVLTVKFNDETLVKDTDYRLEYENNINAGIATINVIGINNYRGQISTTFIICSDISKAVIEKISDMEYTSAAIEPKVVVKYEGTTLVLGTDYTVTYENNINVGTANAIVHAKGDNYVGEKTATFNIIPTSINAATATALDKEYTGNEVTTTVEVKYKNNTLTQGTDYTLEYSNNVEFGKGNITIIGKGNFNASKNITFNITSASIDKATVEDVATQKYTGNEIKPKVVAKFNNKVLTEGTDYTLSYNNNIYTGNATVILTGKGKFKGTKNVTFKIVGVDISEATIEKINDQKYTGINIEPSIVVTYNGKTLVKDKDYIVSYNENINVGNANVIVSGKGSFSGEKVATFKVIASSIEKAIVADIANQLYTGNEVKPKVTVKFNATTLTEGIDYTLEYKNNIKPGTATVTIKGKNNLTGEINKTFSIKGLDLKNMTFEKIDSQVYTGKAITPQVVIKFNDTVLVKDTDYTLEYKNNTKVGKATIIATGINKYSGSISTTFKINYGIIYNLNGGTNDSRNKAFYDNTVKTKLYNPSRVGYTFKGWYLESKFKTKITEIKKGTKGTKTLYAKWSPVTYTIKFNSNGGKGTVKNMTLKYNKSYTLNKNKYTKKGYKFIGWNTKKDGSGISYKNKEEVKNLRNTKGNITLYAQWKKLTYTITYNLNKGVLTKENNTSYTVTTKTFKLNNPTREGYVFKGWYKTKKYTGKVTKITKGSTGNKTLYAKWEPIKYYIIFNKNTGNGLVRDITAKYGKTYTLTKNSYTKKGYKFVGWNTKTDGSGTSYTNKEKVKNLTTKNKKKITLYAQWEIKEYKITYNLNDGVNSEANPNTYDIKTKTITLANPTREGYKFQGWYSDKKFKNKVTKIAKGTTGNKTLYAKWKQL